MVDVARGYQKADTFHTEYILAGGSLLEIGLRYIRFAEEETHLFRFLFQSGRFSGRSLEDLIKAPEAAELLAAELFDLKKMIDAGDLSYMDEYRRASAVIGRPISYVKDGAKRLGAAIGVDDLGRLSVREDSGEVTVLSGSEISLFLK